MNKKKAIICTILFAIIIVGVTITLMLVKPNGGEISLFHVFSPAIAGFWIVDRIDGFYKWLTK